MRTGVPLQGIGAHACIFDGLQRPRACGKEAGVETVLSQNRNRDVGRGTFGRAVNRVGLTIARKKLLLLAVG
jgi:hypothetical protein